MLRVVSALAVAAAALVALAAGASAAKEAHPQVIQLPQGFAPEGIEIRGNTFWTGSVANGAIYRGNLNKGDGAVIVPGVAGRAATGIEVLKGDKILVAGAGTGKAYVYAAKGGTNPLQEITLATAPTFINDVVVTKDAAYFTDSMKPVVYKVPIGPGGVLGAPQTLPLTGDYVHQPGFNLNGIDATNNGKTLIAVQSATAKLFTIDPNTGVTNEIELKDANGAPTNVQAGDGLLLKGHTLFVVQNQLNQVAMIELAKDLGSGTVLTRITNPNFVVPTTMDDHGKRLYAVNAKFGAPNPNNTFEVVQFEAPKVKKPKK